jgi:hypothetical protein
MAMLLTIQPFSSSHGQRMFASNIHKQTGKGVYMKKTVHLLMTIACLLLPLVAPAQGILYVSNLGQTPTGSALIGSNAWIAQIFITGADANGYTLNSVQLLLNSASGNPTGFDVSVYSKSGDPGILTYPGDTPQFLSELNGSTNPATGGLLTYTASGVTLSPSTYYFVVATAASDITQGAYVWSAANSTTHVNGWTILNEYFSSSDGSSWLSNGRGDVFQMALYATAIPEPGVVSLLGLGGLVFLWHRRKTKTGLALILWTSVG